MRVNKRVFNHPVARPNPNPYSPALDTGSLVFVSGQVGTDPATGELAGLDTSSQTRQCLENVRSLLRQAGLDMADVVKCTVFLTRIEDFQAMNAVYREYFAEPLPARSTVGVAALARPEMLVEIEAMALRG